MNHAIYFTIRDLGDRYHRHPATIYRWIKRGLFPVPIRVTPGTSLWPLNVIEEYERDPEAWRTRHTEKSHDQTNHREGAGWTT